MENILEPEQQKLANVQRWVINIMVSIISAGVIGFVNFVYITGRYTEKFSTFEGRMAVVETKVDKMNNEGTYASKSQIRLDESTIDRNSIRLDKIEAMISKLPVLQSELQRLEADIKDRGHK